MTNPDRTYAEQVAHRHVPGRAYEVRDPVTKLIHAIGGGFFNEPKYYDSNRNPAQFYAELLTTGRIASTIVDETGLTEQAREVLETATAVAKGESPEDLQVIAAWAREKATLTRRTWTPITAPIFNSLTRIVSHCACANSVSARPYCRNARKTM